MRERKKRAFQAFYAILPVAFLCWPRVTHTPNLVQEGKKQKKKHTTGGERRVEERASFVLFHSDFALLESGKRDSTIEKKERKEKKKNLK